LPWRSGVESRIIEQLVWQWWMESSGEWLVASGERKQKQVPHHHPAKAAGWVRDDNVKSSGQWLAASGEREQKQVPATAGRPRRNAPPFDCAQGRRNDNILDRAGSRRIVVRAKDRPWAKYRVARFLGVSHTWVNKLVKRIEADPERMRRKMRAFAPATFEKLERAREETRRERERGWLRGPIRWRRVKVTLEGRKRKVVAATRAEMKRREVLREGRVETQRDSASRAGAASSAPTKASAMPVRYSELPKWAIGLPLLGGSGIAAGPGMRTLPTALPASGQAGKPRPVPFAFRRRR
jgi:hypothetical protein